MNVSDLFLLKNTGKFFKTPGFFFISVCPSFAVRFYYLQSISMAEISVDKLSSIALIWTDVQLLESLLKGIITVLMQIVSKLLHNSLLTSMLCFFH